MQLLEQFKALGIIHEDFTDFKTFEHMLKDPILRSVLQNKVKDLEQDLTTSQNQNKLLHFEIT